MEKSTRSRKCSMSRARAFELRRDGDDPPQPRRLAISAATSWMSAGRIDARSCAPALLDVDVRALRDGRRRSPRRRGGRRRRRRSSRPRACRSLRDAESVVAASAVVPCDAWKREDARGGVLVRVHEVRAVAAVHVHVDEARDEDAARRAPRPRARASLCATSTITCSSSSVTQDVVAQIAPSTKARPWSDALSS